MTSVYDIMIGVDIAGSPAGLSASENEAIVYDVGNFFTIFAICAHVESGEHMVHFWPTVAVDVFPFTHFGGTLGICSLVGLCRYSLADL